ncbi:MAG TPA: winged helix DNA-binding domain-containing protein [Actinophytocola sp.]|uniref:winged helix DNA-binding domain-containing protein n=1 Tax=Actinophytocola sp. TaxID=1872138 RepID=UPI002DDD5615|nr:winged helix DNA-binding domain-containing protein [Actinophytocola sp.]HEV2779770.1 winged helix DNA-binding domain-containing protein [Actinophytocola sp.]
MKALTAARTRAARARAQGLGAERSASTADAVRRVVGLQAQDVRACRLAVRVRTAGLVQSDVDAAVRARLVVRTWAMRGTLHMLAAEDLSWTVGLLGPYFAGGLAGRRRQLGLDEATCERGVAAVDAVLAESGPLVRAELVRRIADRGVVLDPRSQAPAHLLAYAAMTGLVCRGPDADGDEPTYVRVADWVPPPPPVPPDEALARLARRYLGGHGPAAAEDFASWCGLPLGRCRAAFDGLAGEIEAVAVAGKRAFVLAGQDVAVPAGSRPEVRLLGHFDTYLLGYRSRELAVPREFDRRIQAGGGFIMPAVLVDGRVVGTWRQTRRRDRVTVTVDPFDTLARRVWTGVRAEVADLGRFLGATGVVGDSWVPLRSHDLRT